MCVRLLSSVVVVILFLHHCIYHYQLQAREVSALLTVPLCPCSDSLLLAVEHRVCKVTSLVHESGYLDRKVARHHSCNHGNSSTRTNQLSAGSMVTLSWA